MFPCLLWVGLSIWRQQRKLFQGLSEIGRTKLWAVLLCIDGSTYIFWPLQRKWQGYKYFSALNPRLRLPRHSRETHNMLTMCCCHTTTFCASDSLSVCLSSHKVYVEMADWWWKQGLTTIFETHPGVFLYLVWKRKLTFRDGAKWFIRNTHWFPLPQQHL